MYNFDKNNQNYKMKTTIHDYFATATQWKNELQHLREILLDCNLNETIKWNHPCYDYNGSNIAIIGGLKNHFVLSFFKGALLCDEHKITTAPGENSQSTRSIKFTTALQLFEKKEILKRYLLEAIEIEKAGLKVPHQKPEELQLIEELQQKLAANEPLRVAFDALTPGRKRAYNIYFSSAKQTATRLHRIDICTDKILKGFGFNDCTCGLSKRMPTCDGSHKQLKA